MATLSYIKEKKQTVSAMKGVIDYCSQDKKVLDSGSGRKLISGVNCQGQNAFTEFMATKHAYKKAGGINFYQYVQSFSPQENITPEKAHEVALEFAAQAWPGHEVLVTTHSDAAHIHSHFVINAVSFEDGHKLRQNPGTLKALRSLSDEICEKHQLSTLKPYEQSGRKISTREYRTAAKGQSWKFHLMADIERAMERSGSQADFIFLMRKRGYSLTWAPERKYITFTCPNGMKCRDNKLYDSKFRKENIENELHIREQLTARLFSGEADPKEFTVPRNAGERTIQAHGLRYPGETADRVHDAPENSGSIPADAVPSDRRTGNSGGAVSGDSGSESDSGQRADGAETAADHLTGWKQSRETYFRNLLYGGEHREGYAGTGFGAAGADKEAGHSYYDSDSNGIGVGLRGLAVLDGLIDDDSEDAEERRKRIQAEQTGADIGAVLGLAVGAAMALSENENEEVYEENNWQQAV